MTLYERVGGDAYFFALVERFYVGVTTDPVLRPLYPEDLGPGKQNLTEFLIQYWGGPQAYQTRRGHPRLRMRHVPFAIGGPERDAWFHHMAEAVRASDATEADIAEMLAYFESASYSLMNR